MISRFQRETQNQANSTSH